MTLNRTPDEIKARIEHTDGVLGFKTEVLVSHLPYEAAEEYLKDDVTADQWEQNRDPMGSLREYLDVAADKARNKRGISAERSVDKLGAWLWLAGRDDLLHEFENARYEPYGRPKLRTLADALGRDITVE